MRYDSSASARTRGRAPLVRRRRSAAAASVRLSSLPRSMRPSSSCAMCACWPLRLTVARRSMTSGSSSSTERWRPSVSSVTFKAFIASCSGLASIACASSTSSFAVKSETRPISLRYMRTGSSSETESIISMSSSISSSICSTSSKSFSPSVTSIPISLNAAKMRNIWSGSASISGKPWRMSSGVRYPCSLPLTMRSSATAMSSSSNLCSGLASALPARGPFLVATLGVVVATFATRAMSTSPFQLIDGACEFPCLGFETRHPLRVLTTFGLGKLADYPTVQALHVVEADPIRQLHSHFVVHARRWRRPCSSNQVLFLRGIPRQLRLEPGRTAALVCLQHPYVCTPVLFVQLIRAELCSHPLEGDRPDREQLQQISAYGQFLPHQPGRQTAFSVGLCFPGPLPLPLPRGGEGTQQVWLNSDPAGGSFSVGV